MGLREQKKDQLRRLISDLATALFIKKGFHNVTVAEIALAANISESTLFNYFPNKVSLIFDEDLSIEAALLDAVYKRPEGMPILEALQGYFLASPALGRSGPQLAFKNLLRATPELDLHVKQMWMRYEEALAGALKKSAATKLSKIESQALSHMVLDVFRRSLDSSDPKASINLLFRRLKDGYNI